MSIETSKVYVLADGVAADGVFVVEKLPESSYKTIMVQVYGKTSPDADIKIRHTFDTGVDLTAADSETNNWFYNSLSDYAQAGSILGETGAEIDTEKTYSFEIDANYYGDMAVEIDNWVAGTFYIKIIGIV